MRITFLILLFFATQLSAAVYQYQDEQGNIIFTDEQVPGSVERKVQSPPVIKFRKEEDVSKKPEPTDNSFTDVTLTKQQEKPKPYTKFEITKPVNDDSFRDNLGMVNVQLNIEPRLQTKFGHKIHVEFDGKKLDGNWSTSTITFSNVDRGTHTLRAIIVDKSGKQLKVSQLVTFHLQRFSRLFGN